MNNAIRDKSIAGKLTSPASATGPRACLKRCGVCAQDAASPADFRRGIYGGDGAPLVAARRQAPCRRPCQRRRRRGAGPGVRETSCYSGQWGRYVEGGPGCDPAPSQSSTQQADTLNTAVMAVALGNYGLLGPNGRQRYTDDLAQLQLGAVAEQPGAMPEIRPSPDFAANVDRPFNEQRAPMRAPNRQAPVQTPNQRAPMRAATARHEMCPAARRLLGRIADLAAVAPRVAAERALAFPAWHTMAQCVVRVPRPRSTGDPNRRGWCGWRLGRDASAVLGRRPCDRVPAVCPGSGRVPWLRPCDLAPAVCVDVGRMFRALAVCWTSARACTARTAGRPVERLYPFAGGRR